MNLASIDIPESLISLNLFYILMYDINDEPSA
jgi:hypothetical protein